MYWQNIPLGPSSWRKWYFFRCPGTASVVWGKLQTNESVILAVWLHPGLFCDSCGGWRQGWGICGAGDTAHSPAWSKPAVLENILVEFTLSWCKAELLYLKCLQSQQAQLTLGWSQAWMQSIQGRSIFHEEHTWGSPWLCCFQLRPIWCSLIPPTMNLLLMFWM